MKKVKLKVGDIIYMVNPNLIINNLSRRKEELYAIALNVSDNITMFKFSEPAFETNDVIYFNLHRNYVDIDENFRIDNGDKEATFTLVR